MIILLASYFVGSPSAVFRVEVEVRTGKVKESTLARAENNARKVGD
jgi:hypothetical protein